MATALMDQDLQTERTNMARRAGKKTSTPTTYSDWKRPNGWKVERSTLTDLIGKEKGPTVDRLDFTGTGTTGSPGSLKVTRTDPDTHDTTVIPDWGTNVVFDSGTDSVTLDHQKPDKTWVTLTSTHDSVQKILGCAVTVNWFGKGYRRRGHGHGHSHGGGTDIGSWTAVEG